MQNKLLSYMSGLDKNPVFHNDYFKLTGGIGANEINHFQVLNNIRGYRDYSNNLYSFGPITQYWQNQNNYAAAFVNAAKMVAQDWVARLFDKE
jgi:hypothetical protein